MIVRATARVVAVDPRNRILLFMCEEGRPGQARRRFWVTPGGGVDPGESFEAAARRELFEETGIGPRALGPCLLEDEAVGRHPDYGDQEIVYRGRSFLVRLDHADLDRFDVDAVRRAGYGAHRWWPLDELERTEEDVWPRGLAAVVRRALGRTP